jgi:hypothetical protein
MTGGLARRIEKLEQSAAGSERAYVWRDAGQTADEAVTARFPEGMPAGVDVTVISWMETALAGVVPAGEPN